MAQTTDTTLDIITAAYRKLTILDEITPPTPEQASVGLEILNEMMSNNARDGLRMGWYPQQLSSYQTNPAPLQDYDVQAVKFLLAIKLASEFGISPSDTLVAEADAAFRTLCKRYILYFESDLTGLPFSQGGLFGPGRV